MKTEKLRIVLDTNIILSSATSVSPYRMVLDELFLGTYHLYVSTEILLEYEEKLETNFSANLAELTLTFLLTVPSTFLQNTYFHFPLIKEDPDDDKFIDCAFAANAHYLVSNDRHYNVLKKINFPKITVIALEEFIHVLKMVKTGTFGFS